jgi:hypothetical protein
VKTLSGKFLMPVKVISGVLILAAIVSGCEKQETQRPPSPPLPTAVAPPFAQFHFQSLNKDWDLGRGEFVVAMLSTSCEHCEKDLVKLNKYAADDGLPPIVVLMFGDKTALDGILERTQSALPAQAVEAVAFFKLIGDAPPRTYVIRNGQPLKFWDTNIPALQEIKQALSAT